MLTAPRVTTCGRCMQRRCGSKRGRPRLGAKHTGSSAPGGAVHLGSRTVPRKCPSRHLQPALSNTDLHTLKVYTHEPKKKFSALRLVRGTLGATLANRPLLNLPRHDLLTCGLTFSEEHSTQHLTRDPCSRGRPRDCTSACVSDRIV